MAINMAGDENAHRRLMKMLCKAAGVDHLPVQRIECICEVGSRVRFNIDYVGEATEIEKAIPPDVSE